MKRTIALLNLSLLAFACASEDPNQNDMLGGDTGANSSGGATMGSGGQSVGAGGATTSSGGATAAGGATTSSGGSTMGSGGNTMGSGGDAMGSGGDTMGGGAPVPSAGCGKANPETGSVGQNLNVSGHNYYVKLPDGYDPNAPHKVMIVFPPTGNDIDWSERSAGYEQSAPDAIRVYTHQSNRNAGWQPNETGFFGPLLDKITDDYCIDESRIFAGGESSGGEFAGFVGCEYGDRLRGVVPTAPKMTGWKIDLGQQNCKGNPTAIVIWSEMDNVLAQPAGPAFRDFYRDMNECSMSSTPVDGYTDAKSNCMKFDGCIPGSDTYFCSHEDPEYGGTYHGWPLMAGAMTWSVFDKL